MPMMAFIGVRISWLMLARNVLFACEALSAASFAQLQLAGAAGNQRLEMLLVLTQIEVGDEHFRQ